VSLGLICRRSAALCSSGLATPGLTAPANDVPPLRG